MDPNYYQPNQNQAPVASQPRPVAQPVPPQPNKKINPYSAQNSLEIAEIRDGVVILKDGSFRAVLKAEAINFDLMSTAEQEAVEYSYQGFLNSLYFPIQISMLSRRANSQLYLNKIEANFKNQDNMLLSVLVDDYLNFIAALIENTDIMSKNFYVIIPYYDTEFSKESTLNASKNLVTKLFKKSQTVIIDEQTLFKAKKELRYRIQSIRDGLASCGVRSQTLDTQELITLYYEYYNPGISLSQKSGQHFNELFSPVVKKHDPVQTSQPQPPTMMNLPPQMSSANNLNHNSSFGASPHNPPSYDQASPQSVPVDTNPAPQTVPVSPPPQTQTIPVSNPVAPQPPQTIPVNQPPAQAPVPPQPQAIPLDPNTNIKT